MVASLATSATAPSPTAVLVRSKRRQPSIRRPQHTHRLTGCPARPCVCMLLNPLPAGTTKLATVSSTTPSATCQGYAYKTTGACSACADRGLGLTLTGQTAATCVSASQSPCCNLPYFYLSYTGTTVNRYAFVELNLISSVRVCACYGEKAGARKLEAHALT